MQLCSEVGPRPPPPPAASRLGGTTGAQHGYCWPHAPARRLGGTVACTSSTRRRHIRKALEITLLKPSATTDARMGTVHGMS